MHVKCVMCNAQEKQTKDGLNHVIEKTTSDILSNLKTVQEQLEKLFDNLRNKNDEEFAKFCILFPKVFVFAKICKFINDVTTAE